MSLVELLSAVLVMLLVTSLLVLGVRIGTKAYVKSVSMSEAQILCATLTTLITDELRYAGTIQVEEDGRVGFFSQNFGGAWTVRGFRTLQRMKTDKSRWAAHRSSASVLILTVCGLRSSSAMRSRRTVSPRF